MLYSDPPCRIMTQGTFQFAANVAASYTIGRDLVKDGIARVLDETDTPAADIETFGVGLAGRRLKSVAFGHGSYSVVLDPRDPFQAQLIWQTFRWSKTVLFHNSPFDVPNLYMNGLIDMDDVRKVIDTLIYARLANPGERVRKNLTDACDRYLKTGPGGQLERAFKALGLSKKEGFRQFDLDRPVYQQGAASDPILTWRLYQVVRQAAFDRLTKDHPFAQMGVSGDEAWDLVERENILNANIGLPRTCKGFRVDFDFADQYQADNALKLAEADRELQALNVRPGNGQDLAKVLDGMGVLAPDHPRTETGLFQMDKKALDKISHPIAALFRQQKEIKHVGKDYIGKCVELADDNGRVHPNVNWLTAATGRVAMGEPPLQQFSGAARRILMADEGDLLTSVDLSQGEPLTIANAAGDMGVIAGYEAGTSDLYTELGVQSGMLPMGTTTADCDPNQAVSEADRQRRKMNKAIRSILKVVLLAQLYGEGLAKLTADLSLDPGPWEFPSDWEIEKMGRKPDQKYPRYAAAKSYRTAVYAAMPKTEQFIYKLKGIAEQHRKMITISGRIVDIPVSERFGRWEAQTHKGPNYFCQGGQYDLIADALLRIVKAGLSDAIYLTMHDEFVVSTSASRDIQKILQTPAERFALWAKRQPILRTDLADLGTNWMAA